MTTPFLYRAWVAASTVMLPIAGRQSMAKLRRAEVEPKRAREKLGYASQLRPEGPLIWFHAASVGESLSVLALIDRMGRALPQAHFLITSGTATSARLVDRRLPPRSRHQFAPLDAPGPLKRFLNHWRPDAALFVESELWPQMLRRTHARGTPLALINARLSQRSIERWQKQPALAGFLFGVFDLILTQNDAMARAMTTINAPADRVAPGINLKSMAGPLPQDDDTIAQARVALGDRPVWIASSTHPGEEKAVLEAHRQLLERVPDLCLILVPRHPERGDEVAGLIASVGLTEAKAKEAGHAVKAGTFPFIGNGKAIALGEAEGFVKTVFDAKTGELLGAHMIGAEVTEMIQGFVVGKTLETTEAELMQTVFPHPTISESMHESVLASYGRALHI